MFEIDQSLASRKAEVLCYFRERAAESLEDIRLRYSLAERKKLAAAMSRAITEARLSVIGVLLRVAAEERWRSEQILSGVLLLTYASYVSMIECRNDIWPYDYMSFSRRVGELWEPFCVLCFQHSATPLRFFIPPTFAEIKRLLSREMMRYIADLGITPEQKNQLARYYDKVWDMVGAGAVKMSLDSHFEHDGRKINIDFKSGFGSNEKGNTNRLLLVATIYRNLDPSYRSVLLVRSPLESNNSYFKILQSSGVWEARCGADAYKAICDFTGFELGVWIKENVDWRGDFRQDTAAYLKDNDLFAYLEW